MRSNRMTLLSPEYGRRDNHVAFLIEIYRFKTLLTLYFNISINFHILKILHKAIEQIFQKTEQASLKKRNVLFKRFPLSGFLAKSLGLNKIAMKSFPKNLLFGVDFKPILGLAIYV